MKNYFYIILCFFIFSLFSCQSNNFLSLTNSNFEQDQTTQTIVQEQILLPELVTENNSFNSTIFIKTDIPKANIYLSNIYQGKTPIQISDIAPGYYLLTVEFNSSKSEILQKKFMIQIESFKTQSYYIEQKQNNSF